MPRRAEAMGGCRAQAGALPAQKHPDRKLPNNCWAPFVQGANIWKNLMQHPLANSQTIQFFPARMCEGHFIQALCYLKSQKTNRVVEYGTPKSTEEAMPSNYTMHYYPMFKGSHCLCGGASVHQTAKLPHAKSYLHSAKTSSSQSKINLGIMVGHHANDGHHTICSLNNALAKPEPVVRKPQLECTWYP